MYAPKTRVFNYLNNPAPGGLTVPVIGVNINSITRDNTRVFNKNEGFRVPYSNEEDSLPYDKKILQPVPVNIGVSMTIVTKYQNDMDQIISNGCRECSHLMNNKTERMRCSKKDKGDRYRKLARCRRALQASP